MKIDPFNEKEKKNKDLSAQRWERTFEIIGVTSDAPKITHFDVVVLALEKSYESSKFYTSHWTYATF